MNPTSPISSGSFNTQEDMWADIENLYPQDFEQTYELTYEFTEELIRSRKEEILKSALEQVPNLDSKCLIALIEVVEHSLTSKIFSKCSSDQLIHLSQQIKNKFKHKNLHENELLTEIKKRELSTQEQMQLLGLPLECVEDLCSLSLLKARINQNIELITQAEAMISNTHYESPSEIEKKADSIFLILCQLDRVPSYFDMINQGLKLHIESITSMMSSITDESDTFLADLSNHFLNDQLLDTIVKGHEEMRLSCRQIETHQAIIKKIHSEIPRIFNVIASSENISDIIAHSIQKGSLYPNSPTTQKFNEAVINDPNYVGIFQTAARVIISKKGAMTLSFIQRLLQYAQGNDQLIKSIFETVAPKLDNDELTEALLPYANTPQKLAYYLQGFAKYISENELQILLCSLSKEFINTSNSDVKYLLVILAREFLSILEVKGRSKVIPVMDPQFRNKILCSLLPDELYDQQSFTLVRQTIKALNNSTFKVRHAGWIKQIEKVEQTLQYIESCYASNMSHEKALSVQLLLQEASTELTNPMDGCLSEVKRLQSAIFIVLEQKEMQSEKIRQLADQIFKSFLIQDYEVKISIPRHLKEQFYFWIDSYDKLSFLNSFLKPTIQRAQILFTKIHIHTPKEEGLMIRILKLIKPISEEDGDLIKERLIHTSVIEALKKENSSKSAQEAYQLSEAFQIFELSWDLIRTAFMNIPLDELKILLNNLKSLQEIKYYCISHRLPD